LISTVRAARLVFAERPRRWLWLAAYCDLFDATMIFLTRSQFAEQDTWSGVIGAGVSGLIGIAIAEIGHRRASRRP
jgi:hypothetical protein